MIGRRRRRNFPLTKFIGDMLVDVLFFALGGLHVFLAPYTKVEESFNLHATHDVLMYGISPEALTKVCRAVTARLAY